MAQDTTEKKSAADNRDIQTYIAGLLNNGKELFFEFDDRTYQGDILDMKLGEYILFRLKDPDESIVHMPINYSNCRIRSMIDKGRTHSFHTKLLQKKLPHILIAFPEKEVQGFARNAGRRFMVQSSPIIMKRKENVFIPQDRTGMGTINDISKGGVRLSTAMQLDKGDKVQIFIDISAVGAPRKLMFPCVVRRAAQEGNMFNVGLEFNNAPPASLKELAAFLDANS